MATPDANAGVEESRVPLASVAPHPARVGCLELPHCGGKLVGGDVSERVARSVGIDESDETSLTH